jgi:hypothetical protein
MNLSEVIEFPAGELTIALTTDKISSAEALSPDAPLLRIPETLMDFYIILTPDPQNKHIPVKLNLVDAGAGKLNPGETLWYNFTQHRIIGKLGGANMSVDPGGRAISKEPLPASGHYAAGFTYQVNGNGPIAPIGEQFWWHDAASRHLGFIVNTGGKLPKLYFFRDFRDTEPTVRNPQAPAPSVEEIQDAGSPE